MLRLLSIISPRMIGGWLGRLARNGLIEILGQNNLGLASLLVKDIVGQGFALVKQSDLMLRIATNCDAGLAQGIARAIGLDLVDNLVELEGQVFGDNALFLPGQNGIEILLGSKRAMCIQAATRRHSKALVEVFDECRQVGIACLPAADLQQAHFLGQAILQGQDDPFDTTFGLGRVGAYDLDVQFLHGASELRQSVAGPDTTLIDPKNAVFIAVEGNWFAM